MILWRVSSRAPKVYALLVVGKYDRLCNLSGKRTEQIVDIICITVLSGKSIIVIGFF